MSPDELLRIADALVGRAEPGEQMEVAVSDGTSTSIKVYGGEVESFTSAQSQGIGIRVIVDGREGFASAGTLDDDVVSAMLAEARDNARFAEADEFAGVAQPDGVDAVEIDLWHDETIEMATEAKIDLAIELERRVRDADPRITGVRTAGFGDSAAQFALASTSGIRASTRATAVSMSVQALADDTDGRTQTGYAYDAGRKPSTLSTDFVVDRAVGRTLGLLGSTKPSSGTVKLVLDPYLSATVLGLTAGTLTADRVLKGRSPFADRIGEKIAADALVMFDDATDPDSMGADSHDGEGLACRPAPLVTNGELSGYLYDAYNARKAGVTSTGSAVRGTRGLPTPGLHALHVAGGDGGDLEELISSVDYGVLVFSLAGLHSGVNPVSGDFSVGVEGRMIRNGQLEEPIGECTIGSTLQRLLLDIERIGSDVRNLPNGVTTPSLVLGDVMLSGTSA